MDYSEGVTELGKHLEDLGIKGKPANEVIERYEGNMANLQKHSAIANTTDDWWEWLWNSFYAGMDQFWIDWDNFWLDPQWGTMLDGLGKIFGTGDGQLSIGGVSGILGLLGFESPDDIGEQIVSFFNDVGKYFEGKSLMDLFGLDPNKDYIGDWFASIDWNQAIMDGLKSVTSINIIDTILDLLLPQGASASDGSSDHPSFMDDVSDIIGTDVQAWIDNFTSDPLGTLGIQVPSFDIGGFIASLFGGDSTDSESQAQEKGNSVGSSFATGTEQGLSPVPDILNNAFDLTGVMSIFDSNSQSLVGTATSTALDVSTQYQSMKNNQKTSLDSMMQKNTSAYNDMQLKSHNSMVAMRDSTSQTTLNMTSAWTVMRDSIIASAKKIQDDSNVHFKGLSDTIGGFYRKIQNPSLWGSAGSSSLHSGTPRPSIGRSVSRTITGRGYAGSPPSGSMTISALKQKLCPNGDCGNLFDGFKPTDIVDVNAFLSLVGAGHGFGGWDFASSHYNHIKSKSNKWETGSPIINLLGGIATSTKFKVGEFENGQPQISWEAFQSMAQAIFSAIPYKFYYDSSWKGSWLGALQAGACNCWDGAHALIAFANACGFGGDIVHGTWTDPDGTKYPHVWASINGHKMDTTAWQQRGSWSAGGNVSAVHTSRPSNNQPPVTINITMGDVYGIDDLNSQIEEGIDKGLQKHFNKSYTLGV